MELTQLIEALKFVRKQYGNCNVKIDSGHGEPDSIKTIKAIEVAGTALAPTVILASN